MLAGSLLSLHSEICCCVDTFFISISSINQVNGHVYNNIHYILVCIHVLLI